MKKLKLWFEIRPNVELGYRGNFDKDRINDSTDNQKMFSVADF